MKVRLAVTILALVCVVAGCARSVDGQPSAGPATTGGSGSAFPSGTSTPPLAPTGAAIDVDGLDPCTVFTDQQVAALGVGPPRAGTDPYGNASCIWRRSLDEPLEDYYVESSTSIDISRIKTDSPPFRIGQYQAITTVGRVASPDTSCQVIIGTKPMQALEIAYKYSGQTVPIDRRGACAKAVAAANLAVMTLESRGGN